MHKAILSQAQVARFLAMTDLTDKSNGVHAINLVYDRILEALAQDSDYPPAQIVRVGRLTTIEENFDALDVPKEHPIRTPQHSRFLSETELFRTQMSSAMPPILRELNKQGIKDSLFVCPGLCIRRVKRDKIRCSELHQVDVWQIWEGTPAQAKLATKKLIRKIARVVVPDGVLEIGDIGKDISMSHPYISKVYKVWTQFRGERVSVLEAGMVKNTFLESLDIDARRYCAISLGIILDRAVVLMKELDDIRDIRSSDPRIQKQMKDLAPFREIPKFPSTKRDVSVVVSKETSSTEVRSLVQEKVSKIVDWHSDVCVISETPYKNLPETARARLLIQPNQKNLLVRLEFSSPERTLTSAEVNLLTEQIRQLF